jgi:hypothetical protein
MTKIIPFPERGRPAHWVFWKPGDPRPVIRPVRISAEQFEEAHRLADDWNALKGDWSKVVGKSHNPDAPDDDGPRAA